MLRILLIVGSGSFIGGILRYLVQYFFEKGLVSNFPYGTLIANIAGSFIIGAVFALAQKGNFLSEEWQFFLAIGLCGGFTTFSTFAINNFNMIREQAYGQLFLNLALSLVLSIFAVYLGIILIKKVF